MSPDGCELANEPEPSSVGGCIDIDLGVGDGGVMPECSRVGDGTDSACAVAILGMAAVLPAFGRSADPIIAPFAGGLIVMASDGDPLPPLIMDMPGSGLLVGPNEPELGAFANMLGPCSVMLATGPDDGLLPGGPSVMNEPSARMRRPSPP